MFKDAVIQLGLEREVLSDAVLMTSELAANTLHATAAARTGRSGNNGGRDDDGRANDVGHQPLVVPELWLYLRGLGLERELVCKVFDGYRGWLQGSPPQPRTETPWLPPQPRPASDWPEPDAAWPLSDPEEAIPPIPPMPMPMPTPTPTPLMPTPMPTPLMPTDAPSGRGLQIVHELSGGKWGHHPTRARLGGGSVRGKAVWFAVPAPFAHARLADVTGLRAYTLSADVSAARRQERISARQAARELKAMLGERGLFSLGRSGPIRTRLTETSHAELSVLSVRPGMTLWFRSGAVTLSGPGQTEERWSYADLVEASEQIIRRYEELSPNRSVALVNA
ncbi:MAG: hypothetical protein JO345_09200 [Streptosporangiaceae bacterium]|nr:hypothetical protein [Streptosporangiaceae bacterium]